jgi:hypothetical protein
VVRASAVTPSPGTPGEGGGEGAFREHQRHPHPTSPGVPGEESESPCDRRRPAAAAFSVESEREPRGKLFPVRRRFFTFCSALSVLVFVAICALWVRTETSPQPDWYRISDHRSYGISTEVGGVIGFLQQERTSYQSDDPADVLFNRAGFRYYRITSAGMRRWNLALPFWVMASATAILPLWWVARRARAGRRRRAGHCLRCGYDLRATPERCPECGAAAVTQ